MQMKYRRELNTNYLVLEGESDADEESYEMRMLTGNIIPSLLNCRIQTIDGKKLYYYDVTGRQPLSAIFEKRKFDKEKIILIFHAVIRILELMEEYLMKSSHLIISEDYIFVDLSKKEIYFIYFPGYEKELSDSLSDFTEYMLPKLDHVDQNAVSLGYAIYRTTLESPVSLQKMKECIYDDVAVSSEPVFKECYNPSPIKNEEKTDPPVKEIQIDETEKQQEEKKILFSKKINKKPLVIIAAAAVLLILTAAAAYFGVLPDFTVLPILGTIAGVFIISMIVYLILDGKTKTRKMAEEQWKEKVRKNVSVFSKKEQESEAEKVVEDSQIVNEKECFERKKREEDQEEFQETVILSFARKKACPALVSKNPGEFPEICLNQELIIIGKMEKAADVILALPTISRIHAKICKKNGGYYISDLNSRNGTKVNGKLLESKEEYLLKDGDEVSFSDAVYIFQTEE